MKNEQNNNQNQNQNSQNSRNQNNNQNQNSQNQNQNKRCSAKEGGRRDDIRQAALVFSALRGYLPLQRQLADLHRPPPGPWGPAV